MSSTNVSIPKERKCSICKMCSDTKGDDIVLFGDWLFSNDLTVHYFCLLLSTNLPQRGNDNSGILGFLIRDIRKEIAASSFRKCTYCKKSNASIRCKQCKKYFHLICGHSNACLFTFLNEFVSYCDKCIPLNDAEKILMEAKPKSNISRCYICLEYMCDYHPTRWIYGRCCNNGYAHTLCMRKYALSAGYYLRCVWCKNETFRNSVKLQGVFVPDRDANWESEKGAYRDLHRGHKRCDMEKCNCPRGRDYVQGSKWTLIVCSLCGSFGAHNPNCFPNMEKSKIKLTEFKCRTCSTTEQNISTSVSSSQQRITRINNSVNKDLINQSLYVHKNINISPDLVLSGTPDFSDDSLSSSAVTVIPSQKALSQNVQDELITTVSSPILPTQNYVIPMVTLPLTQKNGDNNYELESQQQHEQRKSLVKDTLITLEVYEFSGNLLCMDKVIVQIDINDPRFIGKTIKEIKESNNLITEKDIIERTGDLSILDSFNKIIDEFSNLDSL